MTDKYVIVDREGLVNFPLLPREESDRFLAWMRTSNSPPAYRIRIKEKVKAPKWLVRVPSDLRARP